MSIVSTKCPCGGTGVWTGKYVHLDGTIEYRYSQPCPEPTCEAGQREAFRREQERLSRAFTEAGMPKRFDWARMEDFPAAVVDRVTTAIEKERGLFIQGRVGVGKTHLAVAAFRAIRTTGLYASVPDLLSDIRGAMRGEARSTDEIMRALRAAAWLCLDDLGAEAATEWSRSVLFQIVNGRYSERRPIIVTSNLSLVELAEPERAGQRTASRLREMCDVIALVGTDRRRGQK